MRETQLNYRMTEIRDTRFNFKGESDPDLERILFRKIFINNFLIMVERNITRYNSHIQALFKVSNLGKNDQGLVLCEGSGVTIYVKKDSGHRHWLGIIQHGEWKQFRLGGRNEYFSLGCIHDIRNELSIYPDDLTKEMKSVLATRDFSESYKELARPGFFRRLFKRSGNVVVDNAGVGKGFVVTVSFTHPLNQPSKYTINFYKRGGLIWASTLEERVSSEQRTVDQEINGNMTEKEFSDLINDYQARLICDNF